MKVVVLDGYTLNPGDLDWSEFEEICDLAVYDRTICEAGRTDEIIRRAEEAEAVFTNKTQLSAETLAALPKLKFVGVLATGYNVVDIEAAKKLGIIVTNIPAYSTNAVAQMAIALLLELCHHVGEHNEAVKRGEWTRNPDFCFWKYPLVELAGKTLGIIGLGRIGQVTAGIAQALGMKVLAAANKVKKELESETLQYAELEELFAKADVISLHCPLIESTRGIINKESIAKMKTGVMIVNTSRGPLIIEEDLANALNSGKVGGAAVDVVSIEPVKADNPLLTAKNCIITPHIAWAPLECRRRLMSIAADNLRQYIAGHPVNVVNG